MYSDELLEDDQTVKSYELHMHFKQGHEFASCLEYNETAAEALELWSERLLGLSNKAKELASVLSGHDFQIHADNNHISFEAVDTTGQQVLDLAVEMNLLDMSEYEV